MELHLNEAPREMPDYSKKNVEKEFVNAFLATLDVFKIHPISVTEDGVFFRFAGKIFRFELDAELIEEV